MEELKKYVLENEDLLELVRDINSYDGSLDWLDYQENDKDFFDTYFYQDPDEAVRAVCYGDYKYTDEYVKFNGYGNLESCSKYEMEEDLETFIDDIIERLIDLYENLYISEELEEKIEEYKENEKE